MASKKEVSILVSLQDMASGQFKQMEASAGAFQSRLGSLKGELAGMAAGAGLTGMAGYAVKAAKDWGVAVDDIREQTGATGEEASKLLAIAQRTGMGIESAVPMMGKFGKAISEAKDEMAKAAAKGEESNDIFSRLDFAPADLKNGSMMEIYSKVVQKMQNMADGADKDRAAMDLFGKKGYEMHDMLNMTTQEMQQVIDRAEKMGLIISGDTAEAWKEFDRNLSQVEGTGKKLAIMIGNDLLPKVQDLMQQALQATDTISSFGREHKDAADKAVILAAEIGGVTIATKALQAVMATFGLGVVNPWIALGVAIFGATSYLDDFLKKLREVPGYGGGGEISYNQWTGQYQKKVATNPVTDVLMDATGLDRLMNIVSGGNSQYGKVNLSSDELAAYQANQLQPWNLKGDTNTMAKIASSSVAAKDQTLRGINTGDTSSEMASLQEKINQMFRTLNEKIMEETGTTAALQLQKIEDEVAKMREDLLKDAKKLSLYGIDTSALQSEMTKYSEIMTAKIKKDQERAQGELQAQTKLYAAEAIGDKVAQAEAEYQAVLAGLDKEREAQYKATGDAAAADSYVLAKKQKSEADKVKAVRDATLEEYNYRLQLNDNLVSLGQINVTQADSFNKEQLANEIAYLQKQLSQVKKYSQDYYDIMSKIAQATDQQDTIASHDPSQAWEVAMKRIAKVQTDYADIIVQSWHDINDSVEQDWVNMMTGAESFSQGFQNIIKNMVTNVEATLAKLAYQQYIQPAVTDLWGSLIGGLTGSSTPTKGMKTAATGGNVSGLTLVGENGPELADFRDPTRIYTADQTKAMLQGGTPNININVINKTGQQLQVSQQASYDPQSHTMLMQMVVEGVSNNVAGSRDFFMGGRG